MSVARVLGPGHPDAACDAIAATLVEEYLRRDPDACTNIRVTGGHGSVFVAGEVHAKADFDVSAVVIQTLARQGITSTFEPFITIEPMSPAWAHRMCDRTHTVVTGYATTETQDGFPLCVSRARKVAHVLEQRRTQDPDWFWMGPDFEVTAEQTVSECLIIVRVEHVSTVGHADVQERVRECVYASFGSSVAVYVNIAGIEISAGLGSRVGSSGQNTQSTYGSGLPSVLSGVGRHLSHPLNAGAWLARFCARTLVHHGHGKAAMVYVSWKPMEFRPSFLVARNERGQDISAQIDVANMDLASLKDTWRMSALAVSSVRAEYDESVVLPWEQPF